MPGIFIGGGTPTCSKYKGQFESEKNITVGQEKGDVIEMSNNPKSPKIDDSDDIGKTLGSKKIEWENELPLKIPKFATREHNEILNDPIEWYHDGIIEKFNQIINHQLKFNGHAFFCWDRMVFDRNNYPENTLYPESDRYIIVQISDNNTHFLAAKLQYVPGPHGYNIPTVHIADSKINSMNLDHRINEVLSKVKYCFFEIPENKINVQVLSVQQQADGYNCGPFSVINSIYFALGKDPQKYIFSGNPRKYLAKCAREKMFLSCQDIQPRAIDNIHFYEPTVKEVNIVQLDECPTNTVDMGIIDDTLERLINADNEYHSQVKPPANVFDTSLSDMDIPQMDSEPENSENSDAENNNITAPEPDTKSVNTNQPTDKYPGLDREAIRKEAEEKGLNYNSLLRKYQRQYNATKIRNTQEQIEYDRKEAERKKKDAERQKRYRDKTKKVVTKPKPKPKYTPISVNVLKDIEEVNDKYKNHIPNKNLIESDQYKNWLEKRRAVTYSASYYNARFDKTNPNYKLALKKRSDFNLRAEKAKRRSELFKIKCKYCGAYRFPSEPPGLCCQNGQVKIPEVEYPQELVKIVTGNDKTSQVYHQYSRAINNSFNFTSFKVEEVPMVEAKPSIKIYGQAYRMLGPLEMSENKTKEGEPEKRPRYAQLYILDNDLALDFRKKFVSDPKIKHEWDMIHSLIHDLVNSRNVFAQAFKLGYEKVKECDNFKIVLGSNKTSDKTFNLPVVNEVAAIYNERDIQKHGNQVVVQSKNDSNWSFISPNDEKYEPLGYPLLFINGERRFAPKKYINEMDRSATHLDYLKYIFMVRENKKNIFLCQGALFLQYLLDMYLRVEYSNYAYLTLNNEKLQRRTDIYKNIDSDLNLDQIGKKVIMPSTVTFTPNWFRVRFQRQMALLALFRKPAIFLTVTCNRNWPEIVEFCKHEYDDPESHKYRPDMINRVFNDKRNKIISDILKGGIFGRCIGQVSVIEFQKRGLPHMHCLIWLADEDKFETPEAIDELISCEIPSEEENPELRKQVLSKHVHGPCGEFNPRAPCMIEKDGVMTCSKNFPKMFVNQTAKSNSCYPTYRRRSPKNGGGEGVVKVNNREVTIDSRWIVPYNPNFLELYDCHSNIEVIETSSAFKYLFKYLTKGNDKTTYSLVPDEKKNPDKNTSGDQADKTKPDKNAPGDQVDKTKPDKNIPTDSADKNNADQDAPEKKEQNEILRWLNSRYLSSSEAMWRTFAFICADQYPSAQALDFHLENKQIVNYKITDDKRKVLKHHARTMLTEWFTLNKEDPLAKHFIYTEIILFWAWDQQKRCWKRRSRGIKDDSNFGLIRGEKIGYIPTVLPMGPDGEERLALYLLLLHVTGPKSFQEIRFVDGEQYPSNKKAAIAMHLMERDDEIHHILSEAFETQEGRRLRCYFARLLKFWDLEDASDLWLQYRDRLCEDFVRKEKAKRNPSYTMDEMYNKTLLSLQYYLEQIGLSLEDVNLPVPENIAQIIEDTDTFFAESNKTQNELEAVYNSLNSGQKNVYDSIVKSVESDEGIFCFIDAPGGTGKTFLLNALIDKLISSGKKVCPAASSGIAGILLNGGGTLHSKFKLPVKIKENSTCGIKLQTNLAQKIKNLDVIIWDEAPMFHKHVLECLHRSLKDLRGNDKLFGGVTMILSGDWRQILPVVKRGNRPAIVDATHKYSELWSDCKIFKLTENMRVSANDAEGQKFKDFLLNVGDGKLNTMGQYELSNHLPIPDKYIVRSEKVSSLVDIIFPNIDTNVGSQNYIDWITQRAIIAPTNFEVNLINNICLDRLPGQEVKLLSMDQNENISETGKDPLPIDFLYTLNEGGMPPHELKLKIGAPVTLLRNMAPSEGHCNGTRYIVNKIMRGNLELKVASGKRKGELFTVPRIKFLSTDDDDNIISFSRKQFPVKLSFALTAHKAQGQSLDKVGVCAKKDFFTHGQFYVAISRATDPNNLHILLKNANSNSTANVVYEEIL